MLCPWEDLVDMYSLTSPYKLDDETNQSSRQANAYLYDPRSRAGYSRQGFFGGRSLASATRQVICQPLQVGCNIKSWFFFSTDIHWMEWCQALKRHLLSLHKISVDQMLMFFYTFKVVRLAIFNVETWQLKRFWISLRIPDGYCGSAYGVSNFDELQRIKQRGSL